MRHEPAAVRLHLRIAGRVQGVGYRWAAVEEARRLRLTGWVRNTLDGGVEAVAEGGRDAVDRFLAWCHDGPRLARVESVREREEPATGEFESFGIRA